MDNTILELPDTTRLEQLVKNAQELMKKDANEDEIMELQQVEQALSLEIGYYSVLLDTIENEKELYKVQKYIYWREKDRLYDGKKVTDRQAEILCKKDVLAKYGKFSKGMITSYYKFLSTIKSFMIFWISNRKNNLLSGAENSVIFSGGDKSDLVGH